MLISLDDLVKKYGITFSGIVHIGAHECEEIVFYDKYIERNKVLWIEAMSDKVEHCKQKHSGLLIENAVVSDVRENVTFNITNNGQSSSILELEKHLIHHPHISVVQKVEMTTTITEDILKKYDIPFNFVNLDIQGAELKALRGMEKYLDKVDYIYTEVNTAHLYKGCALLGELDEYLEKFGFVRKELNMTHFEWGDAFYVKEKNEKGYISVNMRGGLGNQLFQVACAYALSWEYDMEPIFERIDESPSVFKNRPVYFDTILKETNTVDEDVYDMINFEKFEEDGQTYKKIYLNRNKSYLLNGYFQSPKYFKKYMTKIQELFRLESDRMDEIARYYADIKQNHRTVSIHVRHGDYLQLSQFHTVLSLDYYKNAIKYFDKNSLFVVFSDDIEWCKTNFGGLGLDNIRYIEDVPRGNIPADLFELFLMSMCDDNIIANSSFSAWAAYLNKNEHKRIIAPKQWFVPNDVNNGIRDIYDDDWTIIYGLDIMKELN